jgi:hypothetical protein
LLSLYKNQKIIAAYFQNHKKHTTAYCFKKNSATFLLMYSKKYISHSALEDYTKAGNTCEYASLTWCVIDLCDRLHHAVALCLERTPDTCRVCRRAGLVVLTKEKKSPSFLSLFISYINDIIREILRGTWLIRRNFLVRNDFSVRGIYCYIRKPI